MNVLFVISFFTYVSILTIVGSYFYKRQKNSNVFLIGNRSLNYWVTAIATHATDMSAWLFMAFPGAVYSEGIFACWSAIGLITCMYLSWQFIATKLRIATEKYKVLTLSSYFEKRFNDTSGAIRIISSTIALFFFTIYISAGIVALGRALEATFGFTYLIGITLGTIVVSLYVLLGGFIAIAWNDFLQGMFVFFVIILVPIYAIYTVGGLPNVFHAANIKNITLTLFPDYSFETISTLLIVSVGWGIGYFGQPHILINFMGIDNPQNIKKAKYVGIIWQIITLSSATLIGLIGIALFKSPLANNELVFINMVKNLFNPMLAGLILCAILAAAISTMDSQILVSASMLTEDLYKKIFRKTATETQLLTASRIAGLGITTFSFILALNNNESILSLVRYAWCGLGSMFGPLLILSLYSKKINKPGAIAGILVGGFTAGIWKYLNIGIVDYSIIPGFFLSFVSIILVSILTKKQLSTSHL